MVDAIYPPHDATAERNDYTPCPIPLHSYTHYTFGSLVSKSPIDPDDTVYVYQCMTYSCSATGLEHGSSSALVSTVWQVVGSCSTEHGEPSGSGASLFFVSNLSAAAQVDAADSSENPNQTETMSEATEPANVDTSSENPLLYDSIPTSPKSDLDSNSASETNTTSVILATSWAPLLSGALNECYTPDDETCEGGVAAARALQRHYQGDNPLLFMQLLDKDNSFVHMHPLGLTVNRLILNELMGINVFFSSPAILLQNKIDYDVSNNDISWLQTHDMPLLLTNVGVPPSNSWFEFTRAVYFDQDTNLAVMSVSKSNEELNLDAVETVIGSLRYISRINDQNGCGRGVVEESKLSEYLDFEDLPSNAPSDQSTYGLYPTKCWIPIVYHDGDPEKFATFLVAMHDLPRKVKPALVIDTEGDFEEFETPTLVSSNDGKEGGIWVASHGFDKETYFQHKLSISHTSDGPRVDAVEFSAVPLSPLPAETKDEIYEKEILVLRKIADKALENNPIVGYSTYMPFTRDSSSYRRCKAGECPIGNLFTDAARWYANADVAFVTSGGLRGPGWDAGPVRVSDTWDALPFPNNICTGWINGIHLFQLVNYSMSVSTFEGENTEDGGRLLQVSGMRVTYNTQLNQSRLASIDILDRNTSRYEPIERLKLYKFATDSYLCGGYTPYPQYLGSDLIMGGEQPGRIGNALHQEVVTSFLNATTSADNPYNATNQNRLVNDTSVLVAMNLIQTRATCDPGMYWRPDLQSCIDCPASVDVVFSKQNFEFELASGADAVVDDIDLKNQNSHSVAFIPKSIPSWISLESSSSSQFMGFDLPTILGPQETMGFSVVVDPSKLEPGTSMVRVGFGITDGGDYPGCSIQDTAFDVKLRVLPQDQLNQLGGIRVVGFVLAGIVALTSIFIASWVYWNRKRRIVRALQPVFLVTICAGVLVMGSSMVSLSIDDGIASQQGCSIACMSIPWLLSMGFTFAMSALFAKLWRINRLFDSSFRLLKNRVLAQDVMLPLVIMFILNFIILLTWTLVDPLTWQRFVVNGESWNTYGSCVGSNKKYTNAFIALCGAVNIGALVIASWQAWRARDISDEFSEAKSVGIALYSWLQLLVVGFPVLFLIDRDNPTARYFIFVALIAAVCMSMLLIIFLPLSQQVRRVASERIGYDSSRRTRLSADIRRTVNGSLAVSGMNSDAPRLARSVVPESKVVNLSCLSEQERSRRDPLFDGETDISELDDTFRIRNSDPLPVRGRVSFSTPSIQNGLKEIDDVEEQSTSSS